MINLDEATIVCRIFDQHLSGNSLGIILLRELKSFLIGTMSHFFDSSTLDLSFSQTIWYNLCEESFNCEGRIHMRFAVLPTGSQNAILAQSGYGYLIEDQWDDWFQYSTMYDLYIVDSSSCVKYIGKVKIGQKNMGKTQRRPNLPQSFESLSNVFFSL